LYHRHGESKTRLYRTWTNMRFRCNDTHDCHYKYYGAKGVKVCKEWDDFTVFKDWALANGYDKNAPFGVCTIDRIDVDGNYEPSNCRWVDAKTQIHNRGRIHTKNMWTINGKTMNAAEWSRYYNLSLPYVMYRVKKKGMTPYEALTTPKFAQGRPKNSEVIQNDK